MGNDRYYDEDKYISVGDKLEIIYESFEPELWELAVINMSLHKLINKVGFSLLENEYGSEYINHIKLVSEGPIQRTPFDVRVPRFIKTKIVSVNNGSIHQLIELAMMELDRLDKYAVNKPFTAGVLASLAAAVIYSIAGVSIKIGKIIGVKSHAKNVIDVGPNLRHLIKVLSKRRKGARIIIRSGNDEVIIEL
jgi:hypothetical protein